MRKIVDVVVEMVQETVDEKQIALSRATGARSRGTVDGDAGAAAAGAVEHRAQRGQVHAGRRPHRGSRSDDDGARLRLRCIDDGIGFDAGRAGSDLLGLRAGERGGARASTAASAWAWRSRRAWSCEHGGSARGEQRGPGPRRHVHAAPGAPSPRRQPARRRAGAAGRAPTSDAGRVRMLLVEDNEDAAIAMSMSLEYMGYDVIHAPTLREARRRRHARRLRRRRHRPRACRTAAASSSGRCCGRARR